MGLGHGGRGAPTLLRIISGARYSGVPHKVQVRPFTRLAKPKSVTCGHKNQQLAGGEGPSPGPEAAPAQPCGHLDVALLVDEEVLRLQVPVDEVQRVQVLERQDDLGRVEPGVGLAGGTRGGRWRVSMAATLQTAQQGVCRATCKGRHPSPYPQRTLKASTQRRWGPTSLGG